MVANSDPTRDALEKIAARLTSRRRWLNISGFLLRGTLYGGMAAVMLAAATVISGAAAQSGIWWLCWLAFPAGALVGAILGVVWPVDRLRVARALDRAATSADRFASALALVDHHRRWRVRLIAEDALDKVRRVSPADALPFRWPRELRWLPLPVFVVAVILWLGTGRTGSAVASTPELGPELWAEVNEDFRRQLEELPKPRTPNEEKIFEQLKKLASMLDTRPEKREALARIAKLRSDLEKRHQNLGSRNVNMRKAARALRSSSALRQVASLLAQGDYDKAAQALKSLARRLEGRQWNLAAQQFEAAAADFERLSQELSQHESLGRACENCARAAASFNQDQLAGALKKLASALQQSANDLRQCDSLCRACDALSKLERRLAQAKACAVCQGTKPGQCPACSGSGPAAFVRRNNKKGGLEAGWGTADRWTGGSLNPADRKRQPVLAQTQEREGASTAYSVVSPDERANSALPNKEMYIDLIQKAEADLALEDIPIAYREFLRRYFNAIKPEQSNSREAD